MKVRRHGLLASALGALIGVIGLAACAADQKSPAEDPCQKLTGAERTECERPPERAKTPPPAEAKQDEPPPPDTKSEGNDESDTADPPRP